MRQQFAPNVDLSIKPVGSKVWLKNMSNTHRMGGKLDDVYLGPYTVAEVVDKGRYRLQNESGKKLKKLYNGVLLKEHFPVNPEVGNADVKAQEKKKSDEVPSKPCVQTRLGGRKRQQSSCSLSTTKKRKVRTISNFRYMYSCSYMLIIIFPSCQMPWVQSLDLTINDKEAIEIESGLLCDKHMSAANTIMAHQFPNLQGLQSTLLSQMDGFLPISIGSNAPEGKV